MKLIKFELIRQLKKKNILKKFLMVLGITVFVSFLFIFVETLKIVTLAWGSKIIEEKEIGFKYTTLEITPEIISEIIEQKKVLSLVRRKFLKRFLEANRYYIDNGNEFFDFEIKTKCHVPFLKETKIYCIGLQPHKIPPIPCRLFVIAKKDSQIFDLEKLSEFNKFIREQKIWIDTPSKAIKYAMLYIKLVLNYIDEDYAIVVVNSLDEFINRFILGNRDDVDDFCIVNYKTLQQYIKYRPEKYWELLKYKDKIKRPQVIKERNDGYEIIMYAREKLDLKSPEGLALIGGTSTYQLALIKLKFTVYKNGEIDLKKEYLVKGTRQWSAARW